MDDILTIYQNFYNNEIITFNQTENLNLKKGIIVKPDRIIVDQQLLDHSFSPPDDIKVETFIVYQVSYCTRSSYKNLRGLREKK